MREFIIALLMTLAATTSFANEVFPVDPTDYVIEGKDRYGNNAYVINIVLSRKDETTVRSLSVEIYDHSLSVSEDTLQSIVSPHLSRISATNDAGVFGSYISIEIPFGQVGKCKRARKYNDYKSLHISSLGILSGKGLTARIYDPCE